MGWVAEMLTYNTCTWEADAELFKASLTQLEIPVVSENKANRILRDF